MPRRSPGARERVLGAELRAHRTDAGLSLTSAAQRMGWSKAVLSKLETGNRNISAEEVYALATIYGLRDDRRDDLFARATAQDLGVAGRPQAAGALASYEAEAVSIVNWEPLLIPGLLQTTAYARAWMLEDGYTPTEADQRIDVRLHRQQVLRGDTQYLALIGEGALRAEVGGRQTMALQLRDIVETAKRPNVTVRVIPARAVHSGMVCSFVVCNFKAAPPIAYVEEIGSATFHERTAAQPYVDRIPRLLAVSMSETESTQVITEMAAWMEDKDAERGRGMANIII